MGNWKHGHELGAEYVYDNDSLTNQTQNHPLLDFRLWETVAALTLEVN